MPSHLHLSYTSLHIPKEGCQTEHQTPWFPNRSCPVMPNIWARLWAVIPSQLFCVVRRCAPNWRTGPAAQQLQFQVVDFGWGSDPNMRFSNTKPGTGSLSCILHAAFVKLKCAIVKTLGWWVIWLIFLKGRSLLGGRSGFITNKSLNFKSPNTQSWLSACKTCFLAL